MYGYNTFDGDDDDDDFRFTDVSTHEGHLGQTNIFNSALKWLE